MPDPILGQPAQAPAQQPIQGGFAPPAQAPVQQAAPQYQAPTAAPGSADEFRQLASHAQQGAAPGGQQNFQQPGQPAAPVQQQLDPVLEAARKKGYDISGFRSADDFLDAVGSLASAAQVGQRYAPYQADIDAYLEQQRSGTQQAAPAVAAQPSPWDAPEYDPQWDLQCVWVPQLDRYVVRTELAGQVSPVIADKLTRSKQWERRTGTELIRNAPKKFREAVGMPLEGTFDEIVEQRVTKALEARDQQVRETQLRQQTQAYLQQHAAEFYVLDPQTKAPLRNPWTGQEQLTPKGEALAQFANVATQQYGVTEPMARTALAFQLLHTHELQMQAQAAAAAQQPGLNGGYQPQQQLGYQPAPAYQQPAVGQQVYGAQPAQPGPAPAQALGDPRDGFLARANQRAQEAGGFHRPNRDASAQAAHHPGGPIQNPNLSLRDQMIAMAQRQGVLPQQLP